MQSDNFVQCQVGDVVRVHSERAGDKKFKSPKLAVIVEGQYMSTYNISNYWYWRYVNKDGSLGPFKESSSGYGGEVEVTNEYKTVTKVIKA